MYPKTIVSRPVRIVIMLFLFASFAIISPLIVLYTIGYRYDIRTGIVRETGVLSVDVKPQDVHVFIDDIEIKKRIPIRLPDLLPGTYQLSIRKDGYQSWNKELVIEKKQTTYIRNISLFLEASSDTFIDIEKPIVSAVGSEDGRYLLVTTEEKGVYDVALINTETRAHTNLLRVEADMTPYIAWSDVRDDALIEVTNNGATRVYLASATSPETIRSFSYTTKKEQYTYQWPVESNVPTLYLSDKNTVHQLGLSGDTVVAFTSSTLWYVDNNRDLWTVPNETPSVIRKDGDTIAYDTGEAIRNIVTVSNRYMVLGTDGGMKVLKKDGSRIEPAATLPTKKIRYNTRTNEWTAWSPWEIWSIYRDGSVAILNRTGEQVDDVRPLDEFGVLLLVRGKTLTAFNPGYFVQHTLLAQSDRQALTVDIDTRSIYLFTPGDSVIERLTY